jgi:hypothetical protein
MVRKVSPPKGRLLSKREIPKSLVIQEGLDEIHDEAKRQLSITQKDILK